MVASDGQGPGERFVSYVTGGAVLGGALGALASGWYATPVPDGTSAFSLIGKRSALHAGNMAAVAGIFAVSETLITTARGPSVVNSMAAGCAAGALFGAREGNLHKAGYACVLFGAAQGIGNAALWADAH